MTLPARYGARHHSDAAIARMLAQPGGQCVPSAKPTLFIRRGFLDPATCAALRERIDATHRLSTISDSNGDPSYRTGETGDLDPFAPLVIDLKARIVAFTGLDPASCHLLISRHLL